jgi:hypothetical protein
MASSNLLTRRKHDGERLMHDDCRSQHASKITVESRNNIPAIIELDRKFGYLYRSILFMYGTHIIATAPFSVR